MGKELLHVLAALATPDGPKAAIRTGGRYHLSGNTQPLLRDAMCLSILQSRDAALPLLEELAARLAKQPTAWASSTGR